MLILDRSLIDNIAYRNHLGISTHEQLKRISKDRYDKILFLRGLPLQQDGVRYESEEEQEKLSHIIEQTYQNNGYNLPEENFIEVDTIEHRLQSIVERLE
jgi:predicted ATPase